MKPYPKYQDTGIEWIGEVPEEWKVKKMKYISTVNPTKESDFDKTSDEMVTFLPMENVSESGQVCCDNKKSISSLSTGFTYFKKHDVIIAKITPCFENGKGALLEHKLDTEIGFGSTEFHVLRAVESSSPAFLFYITRTYQFRTLGEAFMTGAAGQKRVPTDFIEEFFIALPSLSEQTTIAAFLDRKTEEIDSIISKKERLIELYKEEKAAVINHAVTKGLNPDAKMKDSGIEWLGEIPEHWEVKELKYISKIIDCKNRTPVYHDNGNYLVIRTTNVRNMKLTLERSFFTDEENFREWTKRGVPKVGSVLLTREAPAGEACLVPKELPLCLGQRMMTVTPERTTLVSKFLLYLIYSDPIKKYVAICSSGSTVTHLRVPQVYEMPVLLPSVAEQLFIVQHIETKCSRIDAIISKFKRQIELLKEYRTALISEAVTGKIDVRNQI